MYMTAVLPATAIPVTKQTVVIRDTAKLRQAMHTDLAARSAARVPTMQQQVVRLARSVRPERHLTQKARQRHLLVRLVEPEHIRPAMVKAVARPVVRVITIPVQATRAVLTAVRAITAQVEQIERHAVRVHILQPPTPRHQLLVQLVQRVRIITAPVKALVQLVQRVRITTAPVRALVRLVRQAHINPVPARLLVRPVRANRAHRKVVLAAELRHVARHVMQQPVRGRQVTGVIVLRANAVQDNTVPIPAPVLAQVVRPIRIKAVHHTTTRLVRLAVLINGLMPEQVLVRLVQRLIRQVHCGTYRVRLLADAMSEPAVPTAYPAAVLHTISIS